MKRCDRRGFFKKMVPAAAALAGALVLPGVTRVALASQWDSRANPSNSLDSNGKKKSFMVEADVHHTAEPESKEILMAASVHRVSRRTARRTSRRQAAIRY